MKNTGQTLIELVVALAAAAVVITAISTVAVTALKNTQTSTTQNEATRVAQEGMEVMKQWKSANWIEFSGTHGRTYCLAETCTKVDNATQECFIPHTSNDRCANNVTISDISYKREVTIEHNSSECNPGRLSLVTVRVAWTDSKCTSEFCQDTQISSCVGNLYGTIAPMPTYTPGAGAATNTPTPTPTLPQPTPRCSECHQMKDRTYSPACLPACTAPASCQARPATCVTDTGENDQCIYVLGVCSTTSEF